MSDRIRQLGLFDSNCMLGKIVAPKAGFPLDAGELLEVMDHFEIAEAIVYHSLSKEYHPAFGNPALCQQIAHSRRLHGMWVVMPSGTGDFPAEKPLVEAMRAEGIKAARVFPHPDRHNFSLKDWCSAGLLNSLESLSIPLFVDADQVDWDTVGQLCRDHPGLPLVLTSVGYRSNRFLYPLLEKLDNLHVELSSYCGHRAIEALSERFGAQHLLFGTRLPFFSPGSAVGMLSYARISPVERKLIAGDNLRNMLERVAGG